jgi:GT2 family glycosyltransferase
MNFQIYTMYVNRPDLLMEALRSIERFLDKVVIVDNSPNTDLSLPGFPGEIYRPPAPLFCAQSYRVISAMAQQRGQDMFFIMHSDARASNEVIEEALAQGEAHTHNGVRWGVLFTNYDVLCLHNTAVIKDFTWDLCLPLYYTDVDFYRRLRLAGVELLETGLHVEHMEGGSTASRSDLSMYHFVQTGYFAWRDYYMRKWGGERGQETYLTPFNQ